MESLGAFPDGEWEAFSKMFSSEEPGEDFTSQFLGHCSNFIEHDHKGPLSFCPTATDAYPSVGDAINESVFYSSNILFSNLQDVWQGNIPSSGHETFFLGDSIASATNDVSMSTNACYQEEAKIAQLCSSFPGIVIDETLSFDNEEMHIEGSDPAAVAVPIEALPPKRKFDVPQSSIDAHVQKKPRVSRDVPKNKKNAGSKKNKSKSPNNKDEIDNNSGTSYNSEDDNASQESNEGTNSEARESRANNSSERKRATRGSATDPQSLYARKRRERINERLRILQNLVPNGTKVDISTMLEEAVHYVKFLQLQIKLLSHDDLWMYAPIAYNGLDIGLNQKFSQLL